MAARPPRLPSWQSASGRNATTLHSERPECSERNMALFGNFVRAAPGLQQGRHMFHAIPLRPHAWWSYTLDPFLRVGALRPVCLWFAPRNCPGWPPFASNAPSCHLAVPLSNHTPWLGRKSSQGEGGWVGASRHCAEVSLCEGFTHDPIQRVTLIYQPGIFKKGRRNQAAAYL